MTRLALTLVFALNLLCLTAFGQPSRPHVAYTIVTRMTEYDPKGEVLAVWTTTTYHSATGDSRSVGKSGDYEVGTVSRRGKGVYQTNSRTNRSIKQMSRVPDCPVRTADNLRADPNFARTEDILGYTAYVLINRVDKELVSELYYVPDLGGGTPVKSISTHKSGARFVGEVLSITLGEPGQLDLTGPDYLVIDQEPTWTNNLQEQVISKPEPEYPADAITRGVSGFVNVMITIDDNGQVVIAAARPGSAPSVLREAAVEAAYQATFKPILVDGRPVVARGIISYQFVLPKSQ